MVHRPARSYVIAPVVAALALIAASCGGKADDSTSDADGGIHGDVTVFAAASLTDAFTEIGENVEGENPDAHIIFNFAGSSTLAQQINQGAPADVFASANTDQMQNVVDEHNTDGEPAVFVHNKLQIVVPKTNPTDVSGLDAFADPELEIAICAGEVPCGAASQKAFDAASVDAKPDTLEKDVKAVLTKVELGEADAGLVYVTDVASAGDDVEGIDFPAADKAVNDYPIAALSGAPNSQGAAAFVDYVTSDAGAATLEKYGFVAEVH